MSAIHYCLLFEFSRPCFLGNSEFIKPGFIAKGIYNLARFWLEQAGTEFLRLIKCHWAHSLEQDLLACEQLGQPQ